MSECMICHEQKQGGIHTNGDGFGDAKHVNIVPPEWAFYCWDCYEKHPEKVPNLDNQITEAFRKAGMCGFLEAWIGRCRNATPCAKHEREKCWKCGQSAVSNCSVAGSLVCGMPQCAEHPHAHNHYKAEEPHA